jgi:hypothetical protein
MDFAGFYGIEQLATDAAVATFVASLSIRRFLAGGGVGILVALVRARASDSSPLAAAAAASARWRRLSMLCPGLPYAPFSPAPQGGVPLP